MKQFFKFTFASCLGFGIGMIILISISIFMIIGITASFATLAETPVKPIEKNSVLTINLDLIINERGSDFQMPSLFASQGLKEIGLDQLMKAIDNAANDDNIKGIILEGGANIGGGYATMEQLRSSLSKFKKSNKFIYAYADMYSQKAYYVACMADSVFFNPEGMLDLKGISMETAFYKNAMDKLGIEMQIFKVGTYKSAVEPFIETKMSPANREQLTAFTNSMWSTIKEDIAKDRAISTESIDNLANSGIMFQGTEQLLAANLVDALVYPEQFNQFIRSEIGLKESEKIKSVKVSDMAKSTPKKIKTESKDIVGVVYAVGEIDGTSTQKVNTKKLAEEIFKIKADSAVKAVVLRVNSPGGSAFGSEQVWYALSELKKVKPFVVSMGDMAASGGYYISCDADYIYAEPTTLTGSIGIFGMIPNIQGLTNKIGVTFDQVSTNKISSFPTITSPVNAQERMLMQNYVERGYGLFTKRCADGRKMPLDSILRIAEGRIWTGVTAKQLGLVDELGGIDDAITYATQLAGLSADQVAVKEYPKKKEFYELLMEEYGLEAINRLGEMLIGENYKHYSIINKIKNIEPVQARMPYEFTIQ
ncbi:MAG: signal peptide peptidase SppA [Bacteroidales bacterium]